MINDARKAGGNCTRAVGASPTRTASTVPASSPAHLAEDARSIALAGKSATTTWRRAISSRIAAAAGVSVVGDTRLAAGGCGLSRKTHLRSSTSHRPSASTPPQGPNTMCLGQPGLGSAVGGAVPGAVMVLLTVPSGEP